MSSEKIAVKAVFIFAMHSEAAPLLARTAAEEITPNRYLFTANGNNYGLAVNGKSPRHGCDRIGTEAAILTCWQASELFDCDWFVSAGTSGAFDSKLQVGDCVAATENACYYDHRIDLDEFRHYARGDYPVYACPQLLALENINTGRVVTGHSLDMSPRCVENLTALNASVKEMEAAAIAQLCDEQGWKFSALKVVSNAAGDHASGEFEANIGAVVETLAETIVCWLNRL